MAGRRIRLAAYALPIALAIGAAVLALHERERCPAFLVYATGPITLEGADEIWVVKPLGSPRRILEQPPRTRIDRLSISNSGDMLAFFTSTKRAGASWRLRILNLRDRGLRQVVEWQACEHGVPWEIAWSPDDSRLAFFAGRRLWIIQAASGSATPYELPDEMIADSGRPRHDVLFPPLAWRADSGLMCGLGPLSLSAHDRRVRLASDRADGPPLRGPVFWSPDGKRAATVPSTGPDAGRAIVIYDRDGREFRRIRINLGGASAERMTGFPRWTRDGRCVVVSLSGPEPYSAGADSVVCVADTRTGRTWQARAPLRLGVDTWDAASGEMPGGKE